MLRGGEDHLRHHHFGVSGVTADLSTPRAIASFLLAFLHSMTSTGMRDQKNTSSRVP